jgi:hypothetical protein
VSRTKPLIYPGQLRHGIRHATGGDVAAAIKELLWDCAESQGTDPKSFLAVYCDESGNEFPAVIAGDAEDVWAIEGDGLEILVPIIPQVLQPSARYECRRFRCLVRDHSTSQVKIPFLYTLVRQRLFPNMEMNPLAPASDIQIQRAQWIIDLHDAPDYTGGKADLMI